MDKVGIPEGIQAAIGPSTQERPSQGCGRKVLLAYPRSVPSSTGEAQPYRVTVVCLGNICRSPLGEVVLRDRVARAGLADLVVVDSAGTGDWHIGHDADPRARSTAIAHGYDMDHRARQITPDWFADIDLAIAMDESNYADLERLIARSGSDVELRMMRAFDPDLAHLPEPHPDLAVPDPYYGGGEDFVTVLRMLERASDGLVAELPKRLA